MNNTIKAWRVGSPHAGYNVWIDLIERKVVYIDYSDGRSCGIISQVLHRGDSCDFSFIEREDKQLFDKVNEIIEHPNKASKWFLCCWNTRGSESREAFEKTFSIHPIDHKYGPFESYEVKDPTKIWFIQDEVKENPENWFWVESVLDEGGFSSFSYSDQLARKAEEPVYIRKNEDGTPVGVAVQTIDERFEIALKDIDDGREMTWDDAMKSKLPTKKQAAIICAYLDDINAKLKEAGGEPLDKWYWTSSEYGADGAWLYTGNYGSLFTYGKLNASSVRPVLAF